MHSVCGVIGYTPPPKPRAPRLARAGERRGDGGGVVGADELAERPLRAHERVHADISMALRGHSVTQMPQPLQKV
jgi:hypothetical protein